uniref:Zinc finger protein n=1 Tax=Rhipicephalus appendiculatus TaxID=34631 RepID=A0A131YW12_RHIAP
MSTRVYINVDLDPFCAELVFPKGLDVGGFVSLIFGRFTQEAPRGPQDHGVRHISLQSASRAKFGKELPLKKKVFISVPYGERNPLCTLRDAPLPDDLADIPDASDEEAVDDVILGSSKADGSDRPPSRSEEASPSVVSGLLCPSCGGWFSNTEVLQLHKAMSHSRVNSNKPVKTLYGCKICKKTYSTSSDCLLHKWKHKPESEWPFQCKNCSRGFIRQAAFVRHQQTHNFECKECNRNFTSQERLQEHSVTHQQGRETFLCVHCEQLFLSKAGLERHVLRYHKNASAVSTGERVNEADGMDPETAPEKAAILGSIPVELTCDQCTFGCSQASELAQHVASNHPTVPIFRCKKCEQPFLKEAECEEHMQLKHQLIHVEPTSEGTYLCQICDRRLKTFSGYWGHLRGHTKAKPFLCDQCGHRYTSRGSLTKHKRTHDFANATKCPHCSKEFATLDYMRNHERLVHTRNFKFSCRLCGHKFPNERKQQTHMAVVHEQELTREELNAMTRVRRMSCPDCSFATYSALQFRQHRATHTGRYPFSCTLCDRAFTFRFQLTLHMRRQHRPGGPLMCPHCPRHFIAEDSHRAHVALHGAPHAKGLECTQCKRLYETPRLLEKHQASVHSLQATRFTCKVCNKRFRTSSGIVAHRRVAHLDSHGGTNEKATAKQAASSKNWAHRPGRKYGCSRWKYSCEPCGRFFKFDGSLRAHRVFFHGIEGKTAEEKLCPECGKAFQTELSLAMHLRTHTQEVNFKCSVCSKIYRSRCSLKKHIATAHRSSLRVFCAVCNRGFLSHASMLLHVKFAHKDGAKAGATAEVIADRLEPSEDAATSVTMTDVEAEAVATSVSAMFPVSNVPPVSTMPSIEVVVPMSTVSSVPHMGAALTVSSVPHVATAPTASSVPGIAAASALSLVPNMASVSTVCSVPGIAAATTVSLVPDVASVSTVSSAACMASAPTMPPVPEIDSYPVTASDNTEAQVQDMEEAADSVALPSPSMTSDGMVELEPVQEITELTRMEPGSHEHAAVEHLFASIQQPTASLPVVADGPPLTVVGSAQHMLHMLSVSQVEEVVSEVCLPQNSCPNVW